MLTTFAAARAQMTVTLVFHIIFAAIGIALPLMLVIVEGVYLRTRRQEYRALARKWSKAVGLLFAVGAISGTALSLELGLLWPKYMQITGAVVGHLFGLEGFAFFLEAIFIGLYLYGWDRLSPRAHWWCGVVIAICGAVSGVLILGVNAWMQLPVGFELVDGRVTVSDPIAILKRPGWFYMTLHSTLSCYIAVGFAVAAIYAWSWRKWRRSSYERAGILVGMGVGGLCAVLQPLSGDGLAKFVFRTQPAKFAAMEGQFKTETHAPLRIGGLPDVAAERTRYALEIPGGLSFLATHHTGAEVKGLDSIPRDLWPPVHVTHLAFQTMVGIGTLLVLVAIWFWAAWARKHEAALSSRVLTGVLAGCGFLGFVALEAGWVVTEVGRQPWVIQGVLKTADAVTPASGVQPIFWVFSVLYLVLTVTVIALLRTLARTPRDEVLAPQELPIKNG
jgi:cytochrome bd ubiquinol oxidase subunit I